jgi:hypothetical protein
VSDEDCGPGCEERLEQRERKRPLKVWHGNRGRGSVVEASEAMETGNGRWLCGACPGHGHCQHHKGMGGRGKSETEK